MPLSALGVKPTNLSETLKSVKCNIALPNKQFMEDKNGSTSFNETTYH